jgi:hypothetical protein
MYEKKHQPLASKKEFKKRIIKVLKIDVCLLVVSLGIGMIGYGVFEGCNLEDSFLNASMILGGMGPVKPLENPAAKWFAGCYALFSGITFLSAFAILSAPILHRFLHKFHIDEEKNEEKNK